MYLELGVDASQIHAGYPTDATQVLQPDPFSLRLRGFHPLRQDIPVKLQLHINRTLSWDLTTPHLQVITYPYSVCSPPFSLAVTNGIANIAFFSSAY